MKTTRHDLENMNSDDYAALKDAYFKASDGLFALADSAHLLQPEEAAAIKALRRRFLEKLGHLDEAGI